MTVQVRNLGPITLVHHSARNPMAAIAAAGAFAEGHPPSSTPWGSPQGGWKRYAPGIYSCSTASHGGFWLSPERHDAMAHELRRENFLGAQSPFFEEDESWHLVVLAWPDEFDATMNDYAAKTVESRDRWKAREAWEAANPAYICSALIVRPEHFHPAHVEAAQQEEAKGGLTIVSWRRDDARGIEPGCAIVRQYSRTRQTLGRQPLLDELDVTPLRPEWLLNTSHAYAVYSSTIPAAAA